MPSTDSKIIIAGGGVFGLSTALWLARGGYKNITVFDRCDFDKNCYDPAKNCDGASADINKMFRMTYGEKQYYQELAIEARELWVEWNESIKNSKPGDLPSPLTPYDELLKLCGLLHLAEGRTMLPLYTENLASTAKSAPEFRKLQFIKDDPEEAARVEKLGGKWLQKYHILDNFMDGDTNGFLDVDAGITLADKACTYTKFLCEAAGVKFVLGEPHGKIDSLKRNETATPKGIIGINTCDGKSHFADLVIVACGAWTSALLPEAHRTVEATMGTVMFIDVPKERKDLWSKFHPDNMPVWRYIAGEGDSAYEGGGFPITDEGRLKFGFRARKFTNFQDHPTEKNLRISTPRTKYSPVPINTVPLHGLRLMKKVIGSLYPELADIGFTSSTLCWYPDSIDDDFVIDYVPGYGDSLFICSGGCGHGFKFLPVLGKYVKNQIERTEDQFTQHWRWRAVEEGKTCNGLEEGEEGPRDMKNQTMATASDFKFEEANGQSVLATVPELESSMQRVQLV